MTEAPIAVRGRTEYDDSSLSAIAQYYQFRANTQPKTLGTQLAMGPVRSIFYNRWGNVLTLFVPDLSGANMLTFPNDDILVIPLPEAIFGGTLAQNVSVGNGSYFTGGIPPGAQSSIYATGTGAGVNSNSLLIYPDATSVTLFTALGSPYQFGAFIVNIPVKP